MKPYLYATLLVLIQACGNFPTQATHKRQSEAGQLSLVGHGSPTGSPRHQQTAKPSVRRTEPSFANVIRTYEQNVEAFGADVKGVYNHVWIRARTERGPIIIDVGGFTNRDWPKMVGALPPRVATTPKASEDLVREWGAVANLREIESVRAGAIPAFPGRFDAEPQALAALEKEIAIRYKEAAESGGAFELESIQVLDSKPACAHCGERLQRFSRKYEVPITLVVKGLPTGPKVKEQPDQENPTGMPMKVWMASRGTPGGDTLAGQPELRVFTINPDGDYGSEIFRYGQTLPKDAAR